MRPTPLAGKAGVPVCWVSGLAAVVVAKTVPLVNPTIRTLSFDGAIPTADMATANNWLTVRTDVPLSLER